MSAENMRERSAIHHTHAGWVIPDIQWGVDRDMVVTSEMADMRGRRITFQRNTASESISDSYDWFDGRFYWSSDWLEGIHEIPFTMAEEAEECI